LTGGWISPKEKFMPESRFYHISKSGKLSQLGSLDEGLTSLKRNGFVWFDYCQPTKEDLMQLVEPLGLHPLSIEDCLDENQIPKMEDFPRHTFFIFNAISYVDDQLLVQEVDIFLGPNFLVTVGKCDLDQKLVAKFTERIIEQDIENAQQGPAFLLHVILDRIVDQKFIAIEILEEKLDEAEEIILDDLPHFNPGDLLLLRRALLSLRKSLFHEREILVKICRKDCVFISDKAILFYRDIYDHLAKFFELTESSRDIVTSLMEMYLSMLNNDMARAANDTNMVVRRLTLITTIFMPLTLLAGIGGMSEWSMMTGPENWRIAYPAFLVLMLVLGVANYFFLKYLENKRKVKRQLKEE
jgi:magnesium transporter